MDLSFAAKGQDDIVRLLRSRQSVLLFELSLVKDFTCGVVMPQPHSAAVDEGRHFHRHPLGETAVVAPFKNHLRERAPRPVWASPRE